MFKNTMTSNLFNKAKRKKKEKSPSNDVGRLHGEMAAHASELEIAKKKLTDAVGDNVKQ